MPLPASHRANPNRREVQSATPENNLVTDLRISFLCFVNSAQSRCLRICLERCSILIASYRWQRLLSLNGDFGASPSFWSPLQRNNSHPALGMAPSDSVSVRSASIKKDISRRPLSFGAPWELRWAADYPLWVQPTVAFAMPAFSPLTPYRESGLKVASRHFGFGSFTTGSSRPKINR